MKSWGGQWVWTITILLAGYANANSQAPGVAVPRDSHEPQLEADLIKSARELFDAGSAVKLARVREELKRKNCQVVLSPLKTTKLAPREICNLAQASHLRVGWTYLC